MVVASKTGPAGAAGDVGALRADVPGEGWDFTTVNEGFRGVRAGRDPDQATPLTAIKINNRIVRRKAPP